MDGLARDDRVSHAVQFVDTPLQQLVDSLSHPNTSFIERDQQRLDLVAQVAHRRDTGHASTALERMQVPLEFVHRLGRTFLHPVDQCLVGRFQQLGRFFREDGGDLGVVLGLFGDRLVHGHFRNRLRLRLRLYFRFRSRHLCRAHRVGKLGQVFDQGRVICALAFRVVDVPDDCCDCACRRPEGVESGGLESHLVVVNTAHEAVERGSDGHATLDVRHVGTTVQRMAGAMQLVGDIEGWLESFACRQVIRNDLEVTRGFLREDIVKNRVHFGRGFFLDGLFSCRTLDCQHGRVRIALSKCAGTCDQQADVGLGLGAYFELLDQLGHCCRSLLNEVHHGGRACQRSIDQAIEKIFDGPAVFADALGANHAAAALERVKRAAHCNEQLHVIGRIGPRRQVALDRGNLFLCFLDKQFEELRVHVLCIGRNDRQRHDIGRLHGLGIGRCLCGLGLRGDFLGRQTHRLAQRLALRSLLREPLLDISQHRKARLGVIEHVPGLAAAGLHRFHVVLDADDRVGQAISLFLRQLFRAAALQYGRDQIADALDNLHRTRLVEHQQAGLDAANQRWNAVQPLRGRL